METTIHKKSQVLRELEIFVGEDELNTAIDAAFRDIRPRLNLPGFRPGKAPLSMIKKLHGDAVEGDALEKLAQEKFRLAVEEQKLEPIGTPVMTDLHRHHGEGAHFKISYEVKPDFTLQEYEGLEIEKPIFTITDNDVNERIHYLQFSYAAKEDAPKIKDKESIVTVTFQETEPNADGIVEPPQTTDIYLYDLQVVEALREALMGKSVGDAMTLTLPKVVNQETGESKHTPVDVTIGKIQAVLLPELSEEFCKKITRDKAATELELRMLVRDELETNAKNNSDQALEANMVEALLKKHDFEVPRTITYALIDAMIQETREENKRRGYPKDYGINIEEYRAKAWNSAETRGKWLLLRDRITEAAEITTTDEDIDALAQRDADAYGIKKENLLTYYQKNEEAKERIKSEKLVTYLKQKFVITEKSIEPAQ